MARHGRRSPHRWAGRAVVGMLCLLGLLAMHSDAEHLGGMNLLAPSSSVAAPGHGEHTPAQSSSGTPAHDTASGHHHDSHLMVMCLLVVTTVATVLARRWRNAGIAVASTPSGVSHGHHTFGERPTPTPTWPHDRLCILLR